MQLIFLTPFLLSFASAAYGAASWAYIGSNGPLEWPSLFPGCAGVRQSPINIVTSNVKYNQILKPFTFVRSNAGRLPDYTLINIGSKVEVSLPDIWKLTFQSEAIKYCFKPLQMHWHWGADNSKGSEHLLNGKAYPLELHMVTYDCRLFKDKAKAPSGVNGLAVLGVWYEVNDGAPSDPVIEEITKHFGKSSFRQCPGSCAAEAPRPNVTIAGFDIATVLPKNKGNFYRYMGSLTTPPCTENVLWTMFSTPKQITSKQMQAFRSMFFPASLGSNKKMVDNFRPAQPVNPVSPVSTIRYVSASFKSGSARLAGSLVLLTFAMLLAGLLRAC